MTLKAELGLHLDYVGRQRYVCYAAAVDLGT